MVAGTTTQVELTIYDGDNNELDQLPNTAELTWMATHGIISAETVAPSSATQHQLCLETALIS